MRELLTLSTEHQSARLSDIKNVTIWHLCHLQG